MRKEIQRIFIAGLLVLSFASGCCWLNLEPCCSCYDQVKTARYDLSDDAKQELDKFNAALTKDAPKKSVLLEVCNNMALTRVVVQEISENTKKLCAAPGLSQKQRDDCLSPDCQARLRSEWCAGLGTVIENHLSACKAFRYDGKNCIYLEEAAPR